MPKDQTPDLTRIATAIGDARRVAMLLLLMEGRALTAKELALGAGIEPATATAHLRRLLDDGLLAVSSQGRHKYFSLASEQVAHVIEAMLLIAPQAAGKTTARREREPIMLARYCYDHLAGELGTALLAMMLRKGWLADDAQGDAGGRMLALSAGGEKALAALGVDVAAARLRRRRFACRCLDWSERRDHLAGALGAALAQRMVALRWIERQKHSRLVSVTADGALRFEALGLTLTQATGRSSTTMPSSSA